jgi:hypothetical protein
MAFSLLFKEGLKVEFVRGITMGFRMTRSKTLGHIIAGGMITEFRAVVLFGADTA